MAEEEKEVFKFVGENLKTKPKHSITKPSQYTPSLTDDEKYAIEGASKFHSSLQDEWLGKDSGSVEEYTQEKQKYYDTMSEQHPNIKKELREALKLSVKYYAGGTVPRSARRY